VKDALLHHPHMFAGLTGAVYLHPAASIQHLLLCSLAPALAVTASCAFLHSTKQLSVITAIIYMSSATTPEWASIWWFRSQSCMCMHMHMRPADRSHSSTHHADRSHSCMRPANPVTCHSDPQCVQSWCQPTCLYHAHACALQVHSHFEGLPGKRLPIKGEAAEYSLEVVKYDKGSKGEGQSRN
jgi:hypothetical protein